jgi:uncharacterized protein (TIGR02466 family)
MRLPILPQHIYAFDYPGSTEELVDLVKTLPINANTNNFKSDEAFLLEREEFASLKKWCMECVDELCEDVGFGFKLKITQSWFNRADEGMWHHRHAHPNALISGIFYLTPSGSSTWFSMDSIWPNASQGPVSYLPFYSWLPKPNMEVIHQHPTTPGQLVLFPAWLDHSVNEHDLPDPRYTIAFNTFPTGDLGRLDVYSQLTLP